jgi:hypothetical protein
VADPCYRFQWVVLNGDVFCQRSDGTRVESKLFINPILHTSVWLDNHALTLQNNTAKYYFGEISSSLHTFLKFCLESGNIYVKFKNILLSVR